MAEDEKRLWWRLVGEEERLVVHAGGQGVQQHALKLLPLRGEDVKGQAPSQRHFHQLAARRRKDKAGNGGGGAPRSGSGGVLCADVIATDDPSEEAAWADLDRLLADRSGLHAFRSFLDDEASEHCLNFYLACKYFATAPSSSTPEIAALICESFFGPDAPFPVRVSWAIASRALSSVRGASVSFFHLAVDEARFLLARHYTAFLRSPQFAGLIDATRLGHRRVVTVDLHKEVSQFLTLPSSPASPRRSKLSRTKHSTTSASRRSKSVASVVGRLRSRRREGAPTKSMFTPYRHASKKERDRSVLSRNGAVLRVAAHSWRIHQHVDTTHATTAVFRYYDKIDRTGAVATTLLSARRNFSLRRGVAWKPPNTRPAKLLHTLRDITEVASSRHPVLVHALEAGLLLTAYQDGSVAVVASRFETGNVASAALDRCIAAKLAEKQYGVIASAVCISDGVIVFTLTHSSVIGVATLHDPSVLRHSDPDGTTVSSSSRSFSESSQAGSQRAVKAVSFQRSFVDRPGAFLSVHRTIVLQWWSSQQDGSDNVCVYVVPDTQQLVRLRQFSIPYHIHTLCTSRLDPRTVFVLQRGQPTRHGFSYTLSRCSMRHSEDMPTSPRSQPQRPVLVQQQAVNLALPCPIVICALSPDDTRAVVVTRRGDVHLVCIDANTATTSVAPMAYSTETAAQDPVHVAWHPSSALFAVASRRGVLACYDRALNPVRLVLAAEGAAPLPYLDISRLGLDMSGIAGAYWLPSPPAPTRPQQEGSRALYDSRELVLLLSGSPPAVLRFECSAALDGSGDTVLAGLCMSHLRSGDVRRAARLAREMEWTACADSCFHVLTSIFDEVLKWPLSEDACEHALLAVPAFAWDPEQTAALGLKPEKMRIHALLWRMFEYLLSHGALMRALTLATHACSRDMCRALATATERPTTATDVIVHALATRAQHLAAVQLGQAPESTV